MTLVARLHASDMFDNLYKEDEQPRDRKIEVARDGRLETMAQELAEIHRIRTRPIDIIRDAGATYTICKKVKHTSNNYR